MGFRPQLLLSSQANNPWVGFNCSDVDIFEENGPASV